jgi:hypothetical protein
MGRRLDLHALLVGLLGTSHVYYQEPAGIDMSYPAIVYELDDEDTTYANDHPYRRVKRYQVTVIDRNPESAIPDQVGALRMCSFNRAFKAEGLNHFVYQLFF